MSRDTTTDKDYFEGFDVESAERVKHPLIRQAQALNKAKQAGFDDDVVTLLSSQNGKVKKHINELIRRELMFINS